MLTCCYSEEEGVLTIPAEIDGNKIIKIYPSCFSISQASEIILPDSIEELREMAFYNCKNLKKITLPSSVKLIRKLRRLRNAANHNLNEEAVQALHDIVPTFTTPDEFNRAELIKEHKNIKAVVTKN